jgi:hypothetical protein
MYFFLSAVAWPSVVIAALFILRHSVTGLVKHASERGRKLSFGGFGFEFATLRNVTPATLNVELRALSDARRNTDPGSRFGVWNGGAATRFAALGHCSAQ